MQSIKYLPRLKQLLRSGGVLITDDVLLYGWASGEAEVPKKRKMLARHIREYIDAVTSDPELFTCIIKAGDGIALSVKRWRQNGCAYALICTRIIDMLP